jgi:hypothetical protein
MPGHFTTLWKSRSTSTPSGQLAREAAEYIQPARAESVKSSGKLIQKGSYMFIPLNMPPPPKISLPVRLYMNFKLPVLTKICLGVITYKCHSRLICILSKLCIKKTIIYDDFLSASAYFTLKIS